MNTARFVSCCAALGMTIASFVACGDDTESDGDGSGGEGAQSNGGAGGAPGGDPLVIKNLSVTIDKEGASEMRFTFSLENTSDKAVAQCNVGTIVASTGDDGVVGFDMYGDCNGIIGPTAIVEEDFCPNDELIAICETGLGAGQTSGIIELTGSTYGVELEDHEQPGTVYTLTLEMLADDAEVFTATAETTVD